MKKPTIKIFISAHKPTDYVHDEIFQPIQVGAALHKTENIPGFITDDTGENISKLNERYCELTAQYWAWKNTDYDYYGFFHYRRYLSFSEQKYPQDGGENVLADFIDEDAIAKFNLRHDAIVETVASHDIVLPVLKDVYYFADQNTSMREQYANSPQLHVSDYDLMLAVIKEKYPDYWPEAEAYTNSTQTYFNNMFIMRKDIFRDYCTWLFDILQECDRRIDYRDYSVEALRTPGHLSERLLNIYLMHLGKHKKYRLKQLQMVLFLDTQPLPELKPAFNQNNIAVTMAANDYYVPYLATTIKSIAEHTSNNNNYDLIIITTDIEVYNQEKLQAMVRDHKNITIRFVNINKFKKQFETLYVYNQFSVETYFRLLLPELLSAYQKVLYLDTDLVVKTDLADLFNTNIDGYALAACRDADHAGAYCGYQSDQKEYIEKTLKLKQPYNYFQAGVILFNLDYFRNHYTGKYLLDLAASQNWKFVDQDVLNHLIQDKVLFLDIAWNVLYDWNRARIKNNISRAPKWIFDDYMAARAHPKIIHFAGSYKPWQQPDCDFAEEFWHYARLTPYYEEIINRMTHQDNKQKNRWARFQHLAPQDIRRIFLSKRLPKDYHGDWLIQVMGIQIGSRPDHHIPAILRIKTKRKAHK